MRAFLYLLALLADEMYLVLRLEFLDTEAIMLDVCRSHPAPSHTVLCKMFVRLLPGDESNDVDN